MVNGLFSSTLFLPPKISYKEAMDVWSMQNVSVVFEVVAHQLLCNCEFHRKFRGIKKRKDKRKMKEETPFPTFPVVSANFLNALMEARLLTKEKLA